MIQPFFNCYNSFYFATSLEHGSVSNSTFFECTIEKYKAKPVCCPTSEYNFNSLLSIDQLDFCIKGTEFILLTCKDYIR